MLPKIIFISLLSSFIFTLACCNSQCLDHQKNLLLQLKNELRFNSSFSTKLVQWNQANNNCCHWHGVECDDSGHVISLQLDHESISGGLMDSSGLFRLKYLEKLNLAYNDFIITTIPKGISNLKYLTHLNMSNAGFSWRVPLELSLLSRLVSLDISANYDLSLNLEMLLQNRTGLKELNLDGVGITSSREREKWSHIISSYLPNITTLSLGWCSLSGPLAKSFGKLHSLSFLRLDGNNLSTANLHMFANFPSLTTLSLVDCNLKGSFPNKIFQIPIFQYLDLSGNELLSGSLPPFPQNGSLKSIRLSRTKFSGLIPSSIGNLKTLLEIDLSNCKFRGPIPSAFANLTQLTYVHLSSNFFGNSFSSAFLLNKIQSFANLTLLDLSNNNLSVYLGNKNSSRFQLVKLEVLRLASCNLHDFPAFIKHSDGMRTLDLSNNRIGGDVPSWIWGTQLRSLNLSFNLLTHLQKPYQIPPSLEIIDLQSNRLREELHLPFPPNFTSVLMYLSLGDNGLKGSIPVSLCTASQLRALDMSMNKLSGTIPSCLLDGTMNLTVLDLGRNNINGHIPDSFTPSCVMEYFDVNNNTIQGKIPKSIERCKWLEFMNVGDNIINDTFPCMPSLRSLRVLVLHSNRFHGEVKCSNDSWPELQIIDISSNNFSGSLESINFSSWQGMVMASSAQFGRSELRYDYNATTLARVGVRINMKGVEVELVKIYPDFTAIDFSCNNFRGEMPNAMGDLISLRLLNFSRNALNGSIPKSFGKLGKLESLDLSRNKLTGHIPTELSRLTFLSVLNVSYNELNGEIPRGRQLQTFSAYSFLGNPGLCGFNLNKSCISLTEDESDENEEEKKQREIEWEYVCAALGYAVGLGSFAWLLIFCRRFRVKYFGKIDEIVEDLFDARDRRTRRRAHARLVERNRVTTRH